MLERALVFGVGLLLTVSLAACSTGAKETKKGSGVERSEKRAVAPFKRVSVEGTVHVDIRIGDPQSVTVHGDDNLLADVHTKVEDGTLVISQPDHIDFEPGVGLAVELKMPELEGADVSGAPDMVVVNGLDGPSFDVDLSGASNLHASGRVERLTLDFSGAGSVSFGKLQTQEASIDFSGAGVVHVNATESLTVDLSGAGKVLYQGDPNVESRISGAGTVARE